jgi:peptidoglycan/xylan/chitin deacetylase (PgdA/CDA1 family)
MPPARAALYAATAGILAATAYSVLRRPPPVGWAAAMLVGYAALLLSAVLVLRLRGFVDAVVRGPRGARGVAVTFDGGPDPQWTPRILDLLGKHGATATFFLVARNAEEHPEVARSIVDKGHAVGLRSHGHDRLFVLRSERKVREDLERGVAVLEQVTGQRPSLYRPPRGHTNPAMARVVDALGLVVVGWTIGGRDGSARARPDDVAARVRRDLRDGVIVLLHDAPEKGDREPAAIRALPAILEAIAAERLETVPVARWLEV